MKFVAAHALLCWKFSLIEVSVVSRLPPGPGYPLYLLRRMSLLSLIGCKTFLRLGLCAMPVQSFTQLKLAFIPSPACHPRSKRIAGGHPAHVPKCHSTLRLTRAFLRLPPAMALLLSLSLNKIPIPISNFNNHYTSTKAI